jgi:hypothetical protein
MRSRDLSTTVTAGGNFVPPQYLGELYAELPRPGRQFADAIGSKPLHVDRDEHHDPPDHDRHDRGSAGR